jgi:hypothetical protein
VGSVSEAATHWQEDLFALVEAASELLGVPVLLEDAEFRVLAWSKGQLEADEERLGGILERRAQSWVIERLQTHGVVTRLIGSPDPLFINPAATEAKPRVGCRVQHDGPHLGFLWATSEVEFDPARNAQFRAAAESIADRMARPETQAGSEQDDLRAVLLGTATDEAAARLGMSASKASLVAAAPSAPTGNPATGLPPGVLKLFLAAAHPRSLSARLGDTTYAVLLWPKTIDDAEAKARATGFAREFWDRAALRTRIVLAVSDTVTDIHRLPAARSQADRITVLQQAHPATPRVAAFEDVHLTYALTRLRTALRRDAETPTGVLTRLADYDQRNRTDLVATLRAYLYHFGDVNAAAAEMHLHPNTFRYRLQRIREVADFDPRNPETRFLTELELRLRDLD